MPLHYLPAAEKNIKDVLKWSAENFGKSAAKRYQQLLGVALSEIATDPALDHSDEVRGLQTGIRLDHLHHSRTRAAFDGRIVRSPRHFIAYLVRDADTLIVRVLHVPMESPGKWANPWDRDTEPESTSFEAPLHASRAWNRVFGSPGRAGPGSSRFRRAKRYCRG